MIVGYFVLVDCVVIGFVCVDIGDGVDVCFFCCWCVYCGYLGGVDMVFDVFVVDCEFVVC